MSHLVSCTILEKSKSGECFWTWAYPSMTESQKEYILKKTPVEELKTFFYGKTRNLWFYISDLIEGDAEKFTNVRNFFIVLWAKDFNPDKYRKLGNVLGQVYGKTCDPTQVLRNFISIMTIGICHIDENGSPIEFGMVGKRSKTDIKGLIKHFGLEAILIYSAMLLKKRIIIYHHNLLDLLEVGKISLYLRHKYKFVCAWCPSKGISSKAVLSFITLKTFPSFLPHRKFDDVIFPWLELTDEGLATLGNRRFFISGCYDNSICSRLELADIFVNIPAKEITVSPSAKDDLAMTKIQKDVALYLVQLADSEANEEEVVEKIGEKTQEIISNMRALTKSREDDREVLYKSKLKENETPSPMQNFLVQLATAENILVLESEN